MGHCPARGKLCSMINNYFPIQTCLIWINTSNIPNRIFSQTVTMLWCTRIHGLEKYNIWRSWRCTRFMLHYWCPRVWKGGLEWRYGKLVHNGWRITLRYNKIIILLEARIKPSQHFHLCFRLKHVFIPMAAMTDLKP